MSNISSNLDASVARLDAKVAMLDTAFCYFSKIAATRKRKALPNHIYHHERAWITVRRSQRRLSASDARSQGPLRRHGAASGHGARSRSRRPLNCVYRGTRFTSQESSCTCRGDSWTSSKQYISRQPNVVIALCMLYQRSTLPVSKYMLLFLPNLATILLICGWTQKTYKTAFAGFCPRSFAMRAPNLANLCSLSNSFFPRKDTKSCACGDSFDRPKTQKSPRDSTEVS
jgi:hypothetical protein